MMEYLLFFSFILGQLGRIAVNASIAVSFMDVVVFLYVAIHLPGIWKKRNRFFHDPIITPFFVFVAICFISLCINGVRFPFGSFLAGFLYFLRYVLYAFLYPVIALGGKPKRYWIHFLFFSGVMIAALGLAQLCLYPNLRNLNYLGWDPHFYRLFSTTFDPNFTGIILVMTLILGWYLYRDGKKNMMILIPTLTVIVALVFTFSRSAYLSLITGALSYVFMSRRWKLLAIIGLFTCLVMFFPAIGGISTSFWRNISAGARIVNWQESVGVFAASPLIGQGFDLLRAVHPTALEEGITQSHAAGGFDNSFLFVLATTGIMGCIAYLYFLFSCLRSGFMQSYTKKAVPLGLIYVLTIIVLVVDSQFINSLFYPMILIWFWILSAVLIYGKEGIS